MGDDSPVDRLEGANDGSSWRDGLDRLVRARGRMASEVGLIVVDHGSRLDETNRFIHTVCGAVRRSGPFAIIEPAHMDLASPSVDDAFRSCVSAGARLVIASPFFLLPGRHWSEDIPSLLDAAAARHPGVEWLVAPPLGTHPLLAEILLRRIAELE
ncbi:MAG: cobalamin biosynthesis protein CbiX [Planctomycetes bacterium]|nr:cobalamin biosynthesis protein CbiX [Planctomycetota bacterium]